MSEPNLTNKFEVPSWAGKPAAGLHLDVMKDGQRVPKLMIDQKKCYFFGRNKELNDFHINHQSCSRVHAALVYHKILNRPFLIDLGSTHGTYIGHIRLEAHKPQQVPLDSNIHFGASTRGYIIRERPQSRPAGEDGEGGTESEGNLLGLPETETELDNLTEFNTAHNRRIAAISDLVDMPRPKRKRQGTHISINEEEEVINPEDIDPTVGRFRNLVSTTVVKKKARTETSNAGEHLGVPQGPSVASQKYSTEVHPPEHHISSLPSFSGTLLGIRAPNLAPDVGPDDPFLSAPATTPALLPRGVRVEGVAPSAGSADEPKKKKKYAKEAWPGRKPAPALLV